MKSDMPSVTKPTRFVALFDCHFGLERHQKRGRSYIQPTHNLAAIKAAVKFAEDFRPQALILGGDQLNCGPVSHWHHDKPRLTGDFKLKDEMDLLDKHVLQPFDRILGKNGIKIWHDGNHEAWIQSFIDENPGVEGLIEPVNYLQLRERGYDIYSQGEVSRLGKLYFVHGDVVLTRGTVRLAQRLVMAYRKNIRAGHAHQYDAATEETPIDTQDFHTGVIVPSLSNRAPSYLKNAPNKYMHGFLFGTVWPDGTFNDHVMVINKNKCTWGGKIYDGNTKLRADQS